MDLVTFKNDLKEVLKRGNTLDALIQPAIRRAARWLERKLDLDYMVDTYDYTMQIGDSSISNYPNGILSKDIKEWELVQYFSDHDAEWKTIEREEQISASLLATGAFPTLYYTRAGIMRFNKTLAEALPLKLTLRVYTTFPTADAGTHWLLDNMEDAMQARSIMYLAPSMRDLDLFKGAQALLTELLPDIYRATEEQDYGGMSVKQNYGKVW